MKSSHAANNWICSLQDQTLKPLKSFRFSGKTPTNEAKQATCQSNFYSIIN